MGYGVPAAIAAKIAAPERTVIALTGDGDFLMTGQELATAVQYGAGVLVHRVQQPDVRHDPNAPGARIPGARARYRTRQSRTSRSWPQSYGAFGATAATTIEFATALSQALAFIRERRLPALIELKMDPEIITPNATLSAIRATARLQR